MPFPATLMDYNNQIITELRTYRGDPDRYFGGVHLPLLNTDYIMGIYLNRPLEFTPPLVGDSKVALLHTTDLLFGMKMGNNNLGFRLSYASDSYQQDSTLLDPRDIEESARYIELAAGISSDVFDLGLSLHFPSINSEINGVTDEWGGLGIMANGRYFYKINEKMTCVPLVSLGTSSTSQDEDTLEHKYSTFDLVIGASMNYQINEQTLMVLGIEVLGYQSSTDEIDNDGEYGDVTTTLPAIFIGAETTLKSWLRGRCGVRQSFQSRTVSYQPEGGRKTEISSSDSDIDFMFGFGIQLGSFLMDVDLNQSLFFDGPQFISGQANQMFNRISITYKF